jgi:hypothetical protein
MLTLTKFVLAGVVGLAGLAGEGGDPLKVKPVQTFAGGDSKVDFPMVRMIQTPTAWRELWAIHKGLPLAPVSSEKGAEDPVKPPEVDFAKNQALVVFGGHLANVKAYGYVKTFAQDETAVIQLSQTTIPESEVKDMLHPFVILILPKEPVPIEVQLDSIAKDGSHYWLKLAKYRAPKDAKASSR